MKLLMTKRQKDIDIKNVSRELFIFTLHL